MLIFIIKRVMALQKRAPAAACFAQLLQGARGLNKNGKNMDIYSYIIYKYIIIIIFGLSGMYNYNE